MAFDKARAERIRELLEKATIASPLTDAEASEEPTLFPSWEKMLADGHVFTQEEVDKRPRIEHKGKLYFVIGVHTVQENWTPDTAVSLYTEIKYRKGHRVIEEYITAEEKFRKGETGIDADDVVWISKVDNNVYTPVQYPSNWERKE